MLTVNGSSARGTESLGGKGRESRTKMHSMAGSSWQRPSLCVPALPSIQQIERLLLGQDPWGPLVGEGTGSCCLMGECPTSQGEGGGYAGAWKGLSSQEQKEGIQGQCHVSREPKGGVGTQWNERGAMHSQEWEGAWRCSRNQQSGLGLEVGCGGWAWGGARSRLGLGGTAGQSRAVCTCRGNGKPGERACMCVCLCTCVEYVHACSMHVSACVCMHVLMHFMCVCTPVYVVSVSVHVHVFVWVCMHVYVCMRVCVHVCKGTGLCTCSVPLAVPLLLSPPPQAPSSFLPGKKAQSLGSPQQPLRLTRSF